MRTDHHFQQLWEFTVELGDKNYYHGPQHPLRRTNKATMHGPNADSAQDHYKELHFSVLDNTINEICEQFQENDMNTLTVLNNLLSSSTCYHYGSVTFLTLCQQLSLFKESKLVHSLVNGNFFKLFLSVPMNSASSKKKNSCLCRLKTHMRNTMSQERLSDIAVLNIEWTIHEDLDKTVNHFDAVPGGCRLALH